MTILGRTMDDQLNGRDQLEVLSVQTGILLSISPVFITNIKIKRWTFRSHQSNAISPRSDSTSHISAISAWQDNVWTSDKRPRATEKSALHAFGLVWSSCVLSLGVCCTCCAGGPLLRRSSSITPWTVNAHVHLRIDRLYHTTVPLRGDGLGIAIRRTLWLPTKARCEIAQFRGRRAVRPLQPAILQEKGAPLLLRGTRGNHLHTEHRDPAIKWCKSCPARRARDQPRSASPKTTFCSCSFSKKAATKWNFTHL